VDKRERRRLERARLRKARVRQETQAKQGAARYLRARDLAATAAVNLRARDWAAAVEDAARAAALAPHDPQIVALYARAAEASRQSEHRVASLEGLARCSTPTAALLATLAELHCAAGRHDRARHCVAEARRVLSRPGARQQSVLAQLEATEAQLGAVAPAADPEGSAEDEPPLPLPAPVESTLRTPPPAPPQAIVEIPVTVAGDVVGVDALAGIPSAAPEDVALARLATALRDAESFDRLLAVEHARGLVRLSHQEETARKILAAFLGRALLADEVGLGKTVEAGLVLSEYLLRGRVGRALVLVPASLVGQWREELESKFDIVTRTTDDEVLRRHPDRLWEGPGVVVASLATARSARHRDAVASLAWDLVIVDEAHGLKNHRTESYALVERLRTRFLLLLTATPVENRVEELYNLVTLIRPGHLGGRTEFVRRFAGLDGRARDEIRSLLADVMVRNTRALSGVALPPRFARTLLVAPGPDEGMLYEGLAGALRSLDTTGRMRPLLSLLLQEAGSSPFAVRGTLAKLAADETVPDAVRVALVPAAELAERATGSEKARALLGALSRTDEPAIVFTRFRGTLGFLAEVLGRAGIPYERLDGGQPAGERAQAIERCRAAGGVLLSTDVGSEGLNLQFCHRVLNFDVPWNPMRLEQRIGRLHRIGQEHPVEVLTLCLAGSIEERILAILDERINLFELVVGEIEMILGHLEDAREFPDLALEAFAHPDETGRARAFERLGTALAAARQRHRAVQRFDEVLFRSELAV